MSTNRTDLSQIKKYLSGELDARSMHELEKQALNDPFLMDALSGYEAAKTDQQQNLDDLTQRLNTRIYRHKKSIVWPAIAVAASLFLAISVGGLWLLHQQKTSKQHNEILQAERTAIAKNIEKPVIPTLKAPAPNQQLVVLKPAGSSTQIKHRLSLKNKVLADKVQEMMLDTSNFLASGAAKSKLNDSSKAHRLNEGAVVGYQTQMKRELTGSVAIINPVAQQQSVEASMAGKPKSPDSAKIKLITGQVLSKSDGQPLPGVNVSIIGKSKGVATDAQGRFQIEATNQDELQFAYIGFNAKQVKVKRKDNLEIMLDENRSSLNEVVVTGHSNQQNSKEAHPTTGWENFNRYLEEKAQSPDGKTGAVDLNFTVNPDNSLSNFKITKSLSLMADQKATELVKQGPAWLHNQNGKPETVKVKLQFKP